ncbi:MAG: phasin family protein [Betaproteobacteria bacterium]
MATRKAAKKPAARTVKRTVRSPAKRAVATTNVAHKVLLAGLGAAERTAERVQGNAVKVYGVIARETERLSEMTAEAAQALNRKANLFVKEGQKIQSNVQAAAEAKAREVAKEVKAFAARSEKTFKKGMQGGVGATAANAKEGITRLEHVFEARVAKTLNTFGIPSSQNVRELQARMAELQKALNQLNKRGARA